MYASKLYRFCSLQWDSNVHEAAAVAAITAAAFESCSASSLAYSLELLIQSLFFTPATVLIFSILSFSLPLSLPVFVFILVIPISSMYVLFHNLIKECELLLFA